jgi:hypothetical protein
MRREKKTKAGAIVTILAAVMLLMPLAVMAGDLEPSAEPGSTMKTLQEIYDVCAGNCPSTTTTITGSTCTDAPVAKTGQTTSYATGDDGDLKKGVAWPNPRFTENGDGTVTDNLTGLIWLKNANCFGTSNWATALTDCNTLNSGECDLTDSSIEGDWRLPNRFELESLLDMSNYNPALPSSHPFTGVQSSAYWFGTSYAFYTDYAWLVYMDFGSVYYTSKTTLSYVWPVRGDNDALHLFSFKNIYRQYLKCRKNKRNTANALAFEMNCEENLLDLKQELDTGTYYPSRSVCFMATRPKLREIFAAAVVSVI